MDIAQNTLYLTTPGTYVARDHLTLLVKVPLHTDNPTVATDEHNLVNSNFKTIRIPIHHLESICIFGPCTITPPALDLCWKHGVAVNFLSEHGYLQARLVGVPDTSVLLRRTQFRAADDPTRCIPIARNIIAGKLQNSRNSLLRAARETDNPSLKSHITATTDALARLIHALGRLTFPAYKSEPNDSESGFIHPAHALGCSVQNPTLAQTNSPKPVTPDTTPLAAAQGIPQLTNHKTHHTRTGLSSTMDTLRGIEGMGTVLYFSSFHGMLKQQREQFTFKMRTRRPPRDRINCLLSFIYALLRHDCIAALTATGLDPFVGFLHAQRPNRPALALDLMEEFRPWLADRLAVTLINRQQITPDDFNVREGGAVEFTDAGRKRVITAWQQRKQEQISHPLLGKEFRIGQLPFVQARVLARALRNDIPEYVPFVSK